MSSSLRILHLEDNARDAALIEAMLEAGGLNCIIRHAKTREQFEAALVEEKFDVVLSDFALPNYTGLAALAEVQKCAPDVPFILVSGTIGEEVAVQSLQTGATDYILKQKPGRLAPAIRRALEEACERARRQEAEARVRQQAALLDKAQDAILVRDMNDRIRYWNRGAERLYGWNAAEVLGKSATELFYRETSPSQAAIAKEHVLSAGEWNGELQQAAKDGRNVTVESRWTLVRDHLGEPESILVINTDITERKRMEAQFLRTQRMETIGALAAGIVHDLNNVLAPILMAADVLEMSHTTDENRQMLNLVRTSTERGREMLKQILTFTRGVSGEQIELQPARLIKEIASLATTTFPRRIKIEMVEADGLHSIRGNATQLHQVLLNLCVNARDAIPKGGKILIRAENIVLRDFRTRWQREPVSGPFVSITVSDTGNGIPPVIMEKLFEPFFTTKEVGKGTGLGLSTVLGILKCHGGLIDVRSQPDQGTSFTIYLPAITYDTEALRIGGNSRVSQPETLVCN